MRCEALNISGEFFRAKCTLSSWSDLAPISMYLEVEEWRVEGEIYIYDGKGYGSRYLIYMQMG